MIYSFFKDFAGPIATVIASITAACFVRQPSKLSAGGFFRGSCILRTTACHGMSGARRSGHVMPSLSDLKEGLKVLEDLWGAVWGRRIWGVLVAIVVVAIIAVSLTQIGGFGKSIYSEVRGWFSPTSPSQGPPANVPSTPGGCIITGGENRGTIQQNCK
jgi:hypothetical protein